MISIKLKKILVKELEALGPFSRAISDVDGYLRYSVPRDGWMVVAFISVTSPVGFTE
jgi:hypothetical protein